MGRTPSPPFACAVLAAMVFAALPALGLELWADEENQRALTLDTTLKLSAVASRAPHDPRLFPERSSGAALARLRFGLTFSAADRLDAELAYEHRARAITGRGGAAAGGGTLPSLAKAPFRLAQLDGSIAIESDTFSYRHELDRALVAFHRDWGELIIGRQAVGLGRGLVFSAVDVFAPFTPIEVDREWRRGVDAVRIEYHTSDTSSIELIAAFGEDWDHSAVLVRGRGYLGRIDGEIIVGKRARDFLMAAVVSAAIVDAEGHLELALFDTPEPQPDGALFGGDHLVGKAVIGTSYTFDVGNGLTLLGEYHYSGFGIDDPADAAARLRKPAFQERYLRGDTQILGRHALALQATYPFNEAWVGSLLCLGSPVDGSGLLSASAVWDMAKNTTLAINGVIPWGARPNAGRLESEYGATPVSLFVQLNAYF